LRGEFLLQSRKRIWELREWRRRGRRRGGWRHLGRRYPPVNFISRMSGDALRMMLDFGRRTKISRAIRVDRPSRRGAGDDTNAGEHQRYEQNFPHVPYPQAPRPPQQTWFMHP
jgi:hypothetical protein